MISRNYFAFGTSDKTAESRNDRHPGLYKKLEKSDFVSLKLRLANHAAWMTDASGTLMSWNREAEDLFGYMREEVLKKPSYILYGQQDQDVHLLAFNQKMAAEQGSFANEGSRVKKDGTSFRANSFIISLFNESNELCGFLEFLRDHDDTQYVQGWADPETSDPADSITFLNRTGLAGCILNWGREELVLNDQGNRHEKANIPQSMEIMALSNPGVEKTVRQLFASGIWSPDTNFLFMRGYHFSELLKANLISANNERLTIIIFMVKYSHT